MTPERMTILEEMMQKELRDTNNNINGSLTHPFTNTTTTTTSTATTTTTTYERSHNNHSNIMMKNQKLHIARTLPYLRAVNTLHHETKHKNEAQRKHKVQQQQLQKKQKKQMQGKETEMNSSSSSSNVVVEGEKSLFVSTMRALLMLLYYILFCRFLLAILIYRNTRRNHRSGSGMVHNTNTTTHPDIGNPRSFWEIFRTIPIRTRRQSVGPGRDGRTPTTTTRLLQQLQLIAFIHQFNQRRIDNGLEPIQDVESLSMILSNRDFNPSDYESLLALQEQNGGGQTGNSHIVGATEDEIHRCPSKVLTENDPEIVSGGSRRRRRTLNNHHHLDHNHEEDCKKCVICLEDYQVRDEIRILPCQHSFHVSCIDPWLRLNASCPICKRNIVESLE